MNDLMSLGIHRVWKDAMMDWLAPRGSQSLLDVAGGTGDISFRFLKRARNANATVLDLTEPMLAEGRKEPKRLVCLGSSSGLLGMLWRFLSKTTLLTSTLLVLGYVMLRPKTSFI